MPVFSCLYTLKKQIMVVSGYTLELYCENEPIKENFGGTERYIYDHGKGEFAADGKNCYSLVRKQAKAAGWKINKNGTCYCPTL